jgi:competence protein ComGF
MSKEDERDREWKAFLDKHKEEREFAHRLAEYLNKKYERYFKKEEKYGARPYRIGDKIELEIYASFEYALPWITIFNEKLTVGFPQFWSTERALGEMFRGNYETFLKILEEIEHKENWERYKNDDRLGNEILLYEQADEIANEVNKKYGTNIVFRGGEDCWFETTFSIKDKSLEEVIKEIERNIGPLYEASEKACKIILSYGIDFIFNESIPEDTVKKIKEKYRRGIFPRYISVVLKHKLKYFPIVLLTSMLGPQKVGEEVPFPFTFGKLKLIWSEEDQRIFEELKSKVETRIEKREWDWSPYRGEQTYVFWSAKVLDLEEVKEEIERVKEGKLLSSKDKNDVELLKNVELVKDYGRRIKIKSASEEQRVRSMVRTTSRDMKVRVGELCKKINDVRNQVGDNFLFSLTLW